MVNGIGVDIVTVSRMEAVLNRYRDRFRNRVFTDGEQRLCEKRVRPALHYGGKFAAKEAFLKALNRDELSAVSWKEIEILNTPGGRPYYRLTGRAKKLAGATKASVRLSLSHSGDYAVAFCPIDHGSSSKI
jgi:holo-[acyl-carrier protein] synthase